MAASRRDFVAGASALAAAGMAPGRAFGQGANDRIRIGLIGCGGRGNFLIEQVARARASRNVDLVALCDVWTVNLAATEANAAKLGFKPPKSFRRPEELIAKGNVDAVIIATPDHSHTPILLDALRAGKDAYIEKPMATVLEHANEAVRMAGASDRIVQVGSQRRSNPRHHAGAKLVQSGVLGKVSFVDTAWHDINPRWGTRPIDNVRAEDIDWEAFLSFLPAQPFKPERFKRWHLWKDFTVGTPALLGAHLIDVGAWFMDDPLPVAAVAHGGTYVWKDGREHADTMDCLIEYPKGFTLRYASHFGSNRPTPEAMFFGTRGTFDTKSWTARGDSGAEDALKEEIVIPQSEREKAAAAAAAAQATAGVAGGTNDPRFQDDDHMLNWIDCMRSRARPNAPVEVGYIHTVASIMSFRAWDTGRRQRFDAATRTIYEG